MDVLLLSRAQFGDTAAFHIIWPLLSIGLSLYMLIMECLWLYTRDERYYRQLRFWTKVFALTFALGVASGIPLQFQFGTNWAAFSAFTGDFFGNILGFESTVAFALEAAFLAIFVFGWKRVGPKAHLFANSMIFVGATLSGFWIMAANSWMQIPTGIKLEGTKLIVTDYWAAIFNPGTLVSFAHMWVACVETTLFMMTGICAAALLFKATRSQFFLDTFKYCLLIALVVTPLQVVLGDMSGRLVREYQPQKFAAIELHWDTNYGHGADLNLIAVPGVGRNTFTVAIPDGLSYLLTYTKTGTVVGLNDFAPDTRPNAVEAALTFYSFRIMAGIGFALTALMIAGVWYWRKKRLVLEKIASYRWFWWSWVAAIPLGFIATIAGWMTREIGRQPWLLYNIMRVQEGLSSNLSAPIVATTLTLFTLFHLCLIAGFIFFTYRIIRTGPDVTSPIPHAH